jgi:hypothetical protein
MKRIKPKRGQKFPNFWSVSRYSKWRGCAYQYLLESVLKYKAPPGRAMERGIAIHAKMEQMLKGKIKGMPDELSALRTELKNLMREKALAEEEWTLTQDFKKTYATDWNGAWVRAKLDAHKYWDKMKELLIVDLKTGRFNVAQAQMDLYAGMSPYYYPEAETVRVELWFSDTGEIHGQDYTPDECAVLWERWVKRANDMLSDREFKPNPGAACKKYGGCPMRSDKKLANGEPGPCHEWKRT